MDPVSEPLLRWYDAERRRHLPWRELVSPWRTLVSELMLQQTRVDTVIPYFERFLARFPTPEALAAAPMDALLYAWSGLGYYSRARNLHKAATVVASAGGFPQTLDGLLDLPGVGPYTAAAIASIALGLDVAAVDGNIERVLSRLHRYRGPRAGIAPLTERHLPKGRAGDYNQALMDLGATICTPREPRCETCPISGACEAWEEGDVLDYPEKAAKRPVPEVTGVCGVWAREGRVLLARRPEEGLLGGLYELPGVDPLLDGEAPAAGLTRALRERLGIATQPGRSFGAVRHVFTHRKLTLHVLGIQATGDPALLSYYTALAWVDPSDPGDLGLSTLARKALRTLEGRQGLLF